MKFLKSEKCATDTILLTTILAATITSASYAGKICTLLIKIEEEHLNNVFIH